MIMVEKVTDNIIFQPQKKYYMVMIEGKHFFDQPIEIIQKHLIILERLQGV